MAAGELREWLRCDVTRLQVETIAPLCGAIHLTMRTFWVSERTGGFVVAGPKRERRTTWKEVLVGPSEPAMVRKLISLRTR